MCYFTVMMTQYRIILSYTGALGLFPTAIGHHPHHSPVYCMCYNTWHVYSWWMGREKKAVMARPLGSMELSACYTDSNTPCIDTQTTHCNISQPFYQRLIGAKDLQGDLGLSAGMAEAVFLAELTPQAYMLNYNLLLEWYLDVSLYGV